MLHFISLAPIDTVTHWDRINPVSTQPVNLERPIVFHPSILDQYEFARHQMQSMSIDACTDVAQFNGLQVATLAQFLIAMGIDANRLSVLA